MPPKKKGPCFEEREFGNHSHAVESFKANQISHELVIPEARRLLDEIKYNPAPIPQIKKLMIKITRLSGTNVEQNEGDPFGNGDQSPCGELGNTDEGEETRQILRYLFQNGGDLNSYLMFDRFTQFAHACVIGDAATVRRMLALTQFGSRERMELLEQRETGMRFPPLILTVAMFKSRHYVSQVLGVPLTKMDHFTVFKLLLQYGADVSSKDMTGKSIIHYGAGSYAQDLTLTMSEYCIDAAKSSQYFGQTIILQNLSKTEYNGRSGKLGGYLTENGRRQVILEDGKELSLLPKNIYIQTGENEEEKCILDDNRNLVNDQDRNGMISMHEVYMSERTDVAKFLIKHKVDIDVKDYGKISTRDMAFATPIDSDMRSLIRKYATKQSILKTKQEFI